MSGTNVKLYYVQLDTIDIELVLDAPHNYIDLDLPDARIDYTWEIIGQLEGILKNGN